MKSQEFFKKISKAYQNKQALKKLRIFSKTLEAFDCSTGLFKYYTDKFGDDYKKMWENYRKYNTGVSLADKINSMKKIGLKSAEISKVLNISESTVRKHWRNG